LISLIFGLKGEQLFKSKVAAITAAVKTMQVINAVFNWDKLKFFI